ncbi:hypothetical protein CKA32_002665 [Geitlerinema sp. FC II]|nr:DUF4926 domain-containing protein [Geitlerinema sp. CS-897]PPT10701.1 hypothetical protein CKA32_002665 [Geitlerinema sp. FC II]
MKFEYFSRVVLQADLPKYRLQKGDVATVVEYHQVPDAEDGYTLEVFNALGETLAVVTVSESQIAPLQRNELLQVRQLSDVSG